eukprot:365442-Chlamydomonas_euryale.AAC.16
MHGVRWCCRVCQGRPRGPTCGSPARGMTSRSLNARGAAQRGAAVTAAADEPACASCAQSTAGFSGCKPTRREAGRRAEGDANSAGASTKSHLMRTRAFRPARARADAAPCGAVWPPRQHREHNSCHLDHQSHPSDSDRAATECCELLHSDQVVGCGPQQQIKL